MSGFLGSIFGGITDMASFITTLLEALFNIVISIPSILVGGVEFIVLILVKIPVLITNNMFAQLPFVFRYGLSGCLGVIILISFLKIYSLVKP